MKLFRSHGQGNKRPVSCDPVLFLNTPNCLAFAGRNWPSSSRQSTNGISWPPGPFGHLVQTTQDPIYLWMTPCRLKWTRAYSLLSGTALSEGSSGGPGKGRSVKNVR